MRRLALAALIATACGGDDNGEPPVDTWPGAVTWTWTFSDGAPSCPPDVTTAHVLLASYDKVPLAIRLPPRIVATAACAAGTASFVLGNPYGVPPYGHDTWLELVTADGRVFARSQIANTQTRDAFPATTIAVPRGWVHATWTLVGEASQVPVACDALPASTAVTLYESVATDVVLQPTRTPCTAGESWLSLAPGTYDLTLGAFDALGFALGEPANTHLLGKAALGSQTVTANATLELGTLPLPLPGR